MELRTKRLLLREPDERDIGLMIKGLNDDAVRKYLGKNPYPFTVAHAEEYIAHCQEFCAMKPQPCYPFTINTPEEAIGEIGLIGVGKDDGDIKSSAYLSFWLLKEFWNKGFMSESLDRIISFSREDLRVDVLYADVAKENVPSWKLLEKKGFVSQRSPPSDFSVYRWNEDGDFLYVLRN